MHDVRAFFACGAIAGCVIVAGGTGRKSAELYDAELNRWLRLGQPDEDDSDMGGTWTAAAAEQDWPDDVEDDADFDAGEVSDDGKEDEDEPLLGSAYSAGLF